MAAPEPSPADRIDRRTALQWVLAAASSSLLFDPLASGAGRRGGAGGVAPVAGGYGKDPDLLKEYRPGDLWPLTFTGPQRTAMSALCDVIIPADESGPAASAVGVPDFIDEWISAPYPGPAEDRSTILEGLAWLDLESRRRFGDDFSSLIASQKTAICDDICYVRKAKPEFADAAQFFKTARDLTAGGYYTTPEGMRDIGYRGNIPLVSFEGPPPETLRKLGLA